MSDLGWRWWYCDVHDQRFRGDGLAKVGCGAQSGEPDDHCSIMEVDDGPLRAVLTDTGAMSRNLLEDFVRLGRDGDGDGDGSIRLSAELAERVRAEFPELRFMGAPIVVDPTLEPDAFVRLARPDPAAVGQGFVDAWDEGYATPPSAFAGEDCDESAVGWRRNRIAFRAEVPGAGAWPPNRPPLTRVTRLRIAVARGRERLALWLAPWLEREDDLW